MVGVFRKGKFELLALTETKLKRNREISFCGVNSIVADFQEIEVAREGTAILSNDVWYSSAMTLDMLALKSCRLNLRGVRKR